MVSPKLHDFAINRGSLTVSVGIWTDENLYYVLQVLVMRGDNTWDYLAMKHATDGRGNILTDDGYVQTCVQAFVGRINLALSKVNTDSPPDDQLQEFRDELAKISINDEGLVIYEV